MTSFGSMLHPNEWEYSITGGWAQCAVLSIEDVESWDERIHLSGYHTIPAITLGQEYCMQFEVYKRRSESETKYPFFAHVHLSDEITMNVGLWSPPDVLALISLVSGPILTDLFLSFGERDELVREEEASHVVATRARARRNTAV